MHKGSVGSVVLDVVLEMLLCCGAGDTHAGVSCGAGCVGGNGAGSVGGAGDLMLVMLGLMVLVMCWYAAGDGDVVVWEWFCCASDVVQLVLVVMMVLVVLVVLLIVLYLNYYDSSD